MKEIKAKIKRIEKETARIKAIDNLMNAIQMKHIKASATFTNGSTFATNDAVEIDESIMIQMLAEQKLTIELDIESDLKFITAIELLVSPSSVGEEQEVAKAPSPAVQPVAPPPPTAQYPACKR